MTKAGYYSPDKGEKDHPRHDARVKLAEASVTTIPFSALQFSVTDLVQHMDAQTAEFVMHLKAKNLNWSPADDGKVDAQVTLAANSLDQFRDILASSVHTLTLQAKPDDLAKLPDAASTFKITVRLTDKTKSVRVVVENADGGRIGSAEINRKAIDAAPVEPTVEPAATSRTDSPQPRGAVR